MAITTIYTYPLNGTQREFNIPFEYLARRFVALTLVGTDRRELVLTADFRFVSKTIVQTNVAWGPADGYERIEIRRNTSTTDRLVDFSDGSILRASELNISQIQTLHVAEEARNMVADTISENSDGELDARGRRLANLADATDPGHAVTLRQQEAWALSALNQAILATNRADAALVSQNAAKTSETNSKASEVASKDSETKAKTSETNSKDSELASKASELAAKASELAAKASELASKTSETNSKTSETNAAAYAAALNMPTAGIANALKLLRQNAAGDGYEFGPKAQATVFDPDPAALLIAGAFGMPLDTMYRVLPVSSAGDSTTDFNTILKHGWWHRVLGGAAGARNPNHPDGQLAVAPGNGVSNYYWLFVAVHSTNVFQLAIPYVTSTDSAKCAMKFRVLGGASWSGWKELWSSDRLPVGVVGKDVVAAVTQEAARAAIGVPLSKGFTSAEQALTSAGLVTVTHGLGSVPKLLTGELVCKVADAGYAVGDIVDYPLSHQGSAGYYGVSARKTATEVAVRIGGNITLLHATSGAWLTITLANWRLVIRAWA